MAEVIVNGVRYVPEAQAVDAHPDLAAIVDTLVTQFWGSGWKEHMPDLPEDLRVLVTDDLADEGGEPLMRFAGRLLETIQRGHALRG